MPYTKTQIIEAAYTEAGVANYEFDISPEMVNAAVVRLNMLAANLAGTGIEIQFPSESSDTPAVDTTTYIPNSAELYLVLEMACQIAPSIGKTISAKTEQNRTAAYNNLLMNRGMPIPEQCLPGTMPIGAGNKRWGTTSYPFFSAYRRGNWGAYHGQYWSET